MLEGCIELLGIKVNICQDGRTSVVRMRSLRTYAFGDVFGNGLGLLPDFSDVEKWAYFIITRLYEPIDNLN
jgi:hypothetical protein